MQFQGSSHQKSFVVCVYIYMSIYIYMCVCVSQGCHKVLPVFSVQLIN